MKIFIKIGLWIITILLLLIALPFFPSVPSIILLLIAVNTVPINKVKEIRSRIFSRKKKLAASEGKTPIESPAHDFVNIGLWDIPIEEFLNTAARYERGLNIEQERISKIDRKHYTAQIVGSEGYPYRVSLSGCDCIDYQRRGMPCKHMLRLAVELGEEITLPIYDPDAGSEYDPKEDIELLTERWKAGKITTEAYRKCVNALSKRN